MKVYKNNIEKEAQKNTNFRKVMYTGSHLQIVLISLNPGEDIGPETHKSGDQFFGFESGMGKCIIDGIEYKVEKGDVIVVPEGFEHNVINTSSAEVLKMVTIYAPPNYKDGIINPTKKDAEVNDIEYY